MPRAHESAEGFKALGLETIISPLLEISFAEADMPDPDPDTAIIFTSRNGVRTFSGKHTHRQYDVFCVGDATAQLARANGFEKVYSAGGTASDIIDLVAKTLPAQTSLLHCSGRHVRGSVTERLQALGYEARRREYYASTPIEHLNVEISQIDYVALYSPLGAQIFARLMTGRDLSQTTTLSLSAAVDKAMVSLMPKRRLIAPRPSQSEMIRCLRLDLDQETGLH